MARKVILKVTVFDDGKADISRGPDCDTKFVKKKKKTKTKTKKPSG